MTAHATVLLYVLSSQGFADVTKAMIVEAVDEVISEKIRYDFNYWVCRSFLVRQASASNLQKSTGVKTKWSTPYWKIYSGCNFALYTERCCHTLQADSIAMIYSRACVESAFQVIIRMCAHWHWPNSRAVGSGQAPPNETRGASPAWPMVWKW